jgi:hypothetical protein
VARLQDAVIRVAPLIQVPPVVDGDGSEAHVFAVAFLALVIVAG